MSDYVKMGDTTSSASVAVESLDDPNLSQEEKDLRLAIALQQQENAGALAAAKRRKEAAQKSNLFRTGRSGVNSRLAAIRDKDHGHLSVPSYKQTGETSSSYVPPANANSSEESSDASLARQLQSVEATSISAAVESEKLSRLQATEAAAKGHRTGYSGATRVKKSKVRVD